MPIDPRSYFINVPQSQGPMDMYKDYMSLRDLMDRRRYRDLEEQQAQQKYQWAAEDRQRTQSLRELLSKNPNASYAEMAAYDPATASTIAARRYEMDREQRLLKDAETARRKGVRQQIANIGMSAVTIGDPLQRAQYFGGELSRLIDEGTLKPEEFTEWRIPADRKEAERDYRSAYNPKALQDYLNAEAEGRAKAEEAAREEADYPLERRRKNAEAITAERKAEGRDIGADEQTFRNVFLPGYLQKNRLPATPENVAAAWEEYKRPERASRLLTPDEEEQEIRIRQSSRPAAADLGDPQNWAQRVMTGQATLSSIPQAIRGKVVDALGNAQIITGKQREQLTGLDQVDAIVSQIENYSKQVNTKYGLNALAGGALQNALAKLQNAPEVQGLQRQIGFLGTLARNLGGNVGALSDADIARAIQLIPVVGDSDTVAAQKISDLRNLLRGRRDAILGQAGTVYRQEGGQIVPSGPHKTGGGQTAAPKPRKVWNAATGRFE